MTDYCLPVNYLLFVNIYNLLNSSKYHHQYIMEDRASDRFMPGLEAETNEAGELQIDGRIIRTLPSLREDQDFSHSDVHRQEVMDYGDECFLLKHILTESECHHFINEGEHAGFDGVGFARNDYRSAQRYKAHTNS